MWSSSLARGLSVAVLLAVVGALFTIGSRFVTAEPDAAQRNQAGADVIANVSTDSTAELPVPEISAATDVADSNTRGADEATARKMVVVTQQDTATTPVEADVTAIHTTDGDSVTEQLARAFSDVRPDQTPSGILLERGGIRHVDTIRQADGIGQVPALSQTEFNNALSELFHGQDPSIPEERRLSSPSALRTEANRFVQTEKLIPVSMAIVAYDTLGDEAQTLRFDDRGKAILPDSGPIGETRIFVAATPQVPKIHRWVNRFVVPSSLLVSTGITRGNIRRLSVSSAGDSPMEIQFDQPFSVGDDADVLPGDDSELSLTFEIEMNGGQTIRADSTTAIVEAPALGQRRAPVQAAASAYTKAAAASIEIDAGTTVLDEQCIPGIECYDMDMVLATIPFRGGLGGINVRIYPASGSVMEDQNGRRTARLNKPLIAVDGFDLQNTNTQEDFWVRFGFGIERFVALGFDVVTIDYVNGRDYIERNGYALREFFVNRMPRWNVSGDPYAVVAGSMGTQTSRWALTTAERDDEEHNVGLFVALDGTFAGANIPISIQAAIDFVAGDIDEAAALKQGLDSPAAREQLRRTRYRQGSNTVWYRPHPDAVALNAAEEELGLPKKSRNVAFSNGSGTGTRVSDNAVDKLVRIKQSKLFSAIEIDTFTDHNGEVFNGRIRRFIFNTRSSLSLNGNARTLDRAAGGIRRTPIEIKEVAEAAGFSGVSIGLEEHDFVPTFSGLGIKTSNADYIPVWDPNILGKTDFDTVFWEKCNTGHVEFTPGMLGLLFEELTAFRDNRPPVELPKYQARCGEPEPQDLCITPVTWLGDESVRNIVPWNDGANCFVSSAPGGRAGFVENNNYYITTDADGSCAAGRAVTLEERGASCLVGQAPDGMRAFFWNNGFYYDGFD